MYSLTFLNRLVMLSKSSASIVNRSASFSLCFRCSCGLYFVGFVTTHSRIWLILKRMASSSSHLIAVYVVTMVNCLGRGTLNSTHHYREYSVRACLFKIRNVLNPQTPDSYILKQTEQVEQSGKGNTCTGTSEECQERHRTLFPPLPKSRV